MSNIIQQLYDEYNDYRNEMKEKGIDYVSFKEFCSMNGYK